MATMRFRRAEVLANCITAEAASRADVAAQIGRCPSGALKWYDPGQPLPVLPELDDDHLDGA